MEHSKNSETVIGIVGGSGLYALENIKDLEEISVETPYGKPSAPFMVGKMGGAKVVFLARHGRNHEFLPSEVPYRANIYALKSLGVRYLLSVSAVGSLREEIAPRDIVLVSQYIDYTKTRTMTFLGEGIVGHVSMAQPTCLKLNDILHGSAVKVLADSGQKAHLGGTYICIEGPHFSSLAESKLFRIMGADLVGMTNMPEAKLAREAQIAYASMAMVTDYDCWRGLEEAVTVEMAISNLKANTENAQKIVALAVEQIAAQKPLSIAHNVLETAVFTPFEILPPAKRELFNLLRS